MTPEILEDMVAKRRDRAIAAILAQKDLCDAYLPEELSRRLRKTVLDQINDLADTLTDLLKAVNDERIVVNEWYLERRFMEVRELIRSP